MPGRLSIAALCSLLLLTGCLEAASNASLGDPLGIFQSRNINLVEKNYAAADYLADRAKNYVGHADTIRAMPLLDVGEPRIITRLGKEIPEQVGERLVQLGYQVDTSAVNTNLAPSYAPTPQVVASRPGYILAGSYRDKGAVIDVSLTIKDAMTGQERAGFNYTLPHVGEVRKHANQAPAFQKTTNN